MPIDFGYKNIESCIISNPANRNCKECWNREVEEPKKKEELSKAFLSPAMLNDKLGLNNFNLSKMAKKLNEEAVEVMEAVVFYRMESLLENKFTADVRDDLIQEILDVSQMALNMLYVIKTTTGTDVYEMILEHNEKLIDRGWEFDNSLYLKIINNEVEE